MCNDHQNRRFHRISKTVIITDKDFDVGVEHQWCALQFFKKIEIKNKTKKRKNKNK